MSQAEIQECLTLLVGDGNFRTALAPEISADDFAENILGFEEVEEMEDDGSGEYQPEGGALGQSVMGSQVNGTMKHSLRNEIIPEEDDI